MCIRDRLIPVDMLGTVYHCYALVRNKSTTCVLLRTFEFLSRKAGTAYQQFIIYKRSKVQRFRSDIKVDVDSCNEQWAISHIPYRYIEVAHQDRKCRRQHQTCLVCWSRRNRGRYYSSLRSFGGIFNKSATKSWGSKTYFEDTSASEYRASSDDRR